MTLFRICKWITAVILCLIHDWEPNYWEGLFLLAERVKL